MSDSRTRPLVFGAELSPYSVKVRSYLRYKGSTTNGPSETRRTWACTRSMRSCR